jgi:hypothetical protein
MFELPTLYAEAIDLTSRESDSIGTTPVRDIQLETSI